MIDEIAAIRERRRAAYGLLGDSPDSIILSAMLADIATLLARLDAVGERDDCIRDLAHAIGPHCQGCYVCKQVMKRHAAIINAALTAGPGTEGTG